MSRMLMALALGLGVATSSAQATTWSDYEESFPAFPCLDGWTACYQGGERITPDLVQRGGMPSPSNARVDWFTLEPTSAFSPFVGLTAYDLSVAPVAVAPDPMPVDPMPVDPVPVIEPEPYDPGPVPVNTTPDPEPMVRPDPTPDPAPMVRPDPSPMVRPDPRPGPAPLVRPDPTPDPAPLVRPQPPTPDPGGMVRPGPNTVTPAPIVEVQPPTPQPPAPEPVVRPDPAPVVVPAPLVVPGPVTCDDLVRLESSALIGRLSAEQSACLEASFADAARQTDKKKISLLLIANANGKGDKRAWEALVRRHLDDIDQSDPDICYAYATHLARKGPGRAESVIRWSEVALENRTRWVGETYKSRVYGLYKLRAAAANTLWIRAETRHAEAQTDETESTVERTRGRLKTYAREWYEYAKEAGKDTTTPLQLCVSAAGTSEFCEGR
ncbi:MAG: hypothetical protein ACJATT_001651 [Myxococcota bacterium]|jgi:hypothetical protein